MKISACSQKTVYLIVRRPPLNNHSTFSMNICVRKAIPSMKLSRWQLDKYIGLFYANVRKIDHSSYSRNSMYTLRYGLQNYIKKTFKIDIISHETFRPSNEIFCAVLVQLKKNGMGSVIHKKPRTPEDFSKLYSYDVLSASTPEGLQNKVFVDLMVQLCNRGRENLRDLRREDFELNTDSSGTRYVSMKDKQTKKPPWWFLWGIEPTRSYVRNARFHSVSSCIVWEIHL